MPSEGSSKGTCISCGGVTARATYTYCSNTCQFAYQHEQYITAWKDGTVKGLQRMGIVSTHIKRYLREKFGNKCCVCGWAEVNPKTKQVPLVADHIDGNWRNNSESNLRLICPNCDALSPTYAALNKGKGRVDRAVSNRAKEARLMIQKKK